MARLIVFGTPNGFSYSENLNTEPEFFQKFNIQRNGIQFRSFIRPDGNHYILSIYPENGKNFFDINGNNVGFLSIDFVADKTQIINPMQIQSLLKKTYETYVKNTIVQETQNGDRKFIISDLKSPNNKIAQDVYDGLIKITKTNPELDIFKVNPNQTIFGMINQPRS